jgi:hypothetical protein
MTCADPTTSAAWGSRAFEEGRPVERRKRKTVIVLPTNSCRQDPGCLGGYTGSGKITGSGVNR